MIISSLLIMFSKMGISMYINCGNVSSMFKKRFKFRFWKFAKEKWINYASSPLWCSIAPREKSSNFQMENAWTLYFCFELNQKYLLMKFPKPKNSGKWTNRWTNIWNIANRRYKAIKNFLILQITSFKNSTRPHRKSKMNTSKDKNKNLPLWWNKMKINHDFKHSNKK